MDQGLGVKTSHEAMPNVGMFSEFQAQLEGIRKSVHLLEGSVEALEGRFGTVERDISEQRTEMRSIMANLIGTLERPGSLELLRRTNAKQEEMCEQMERMAGALERLQGTRRYAVGWVGGAVGLIGVVAWIISILVRWIK